MNNANGAIEKFESLMRIRMKDGSIISPGPFFTIANRELRRGLAVHRADEGKGGQDRH
jgi:EAL domain-containing protein (putative c-di-GMP-specific phosphodiesterase class I)